MLDPIPQHPYPSGLAVHDAAETSTRVRTHGSARVVAHRPHADGTFTYTVERLSEGTRAEWASYFTIPAGMWAMAGDGDGPARDDGGTGVGTADLPHRTIGDGERSQADGEAPAQQWSPPPAQDTEDAPKA